MGLHARHPWNAECNKCLLSTIASNNWTMSLLIEQRRREGRGAVKELVMGWGWISGVSQLWPLMLSYMACDATASGLCGTELTPPKGGTMESPLQCGVTQFTLISHKQEDFSNSNKQMLQQWEVAELSIEGKKEAGGQQQIKTAFVLAISRVKSGSESFWWLSDTPPALR